MTLQWIVSLHCGVKEARNHAAWPVLRQATRDEYNNQLKYGVYHLDEGNVGLNTVPVQ